MDDRKEPGPQATRSTDSPEGVIIPRVEETVRVGKRRRETGRVRVSKTTVPEDVHLKQDLTEEKIEVERVAKDEVLSERPEVRVEGDTTIIPVVDEIVEVSKKYVLREELHIRKRTRTFTQNVDATVHHDVVNVDRLGPAEPEPHESTRNENGSEPLS